MRDKENRKNPDGKIGRIRAILPGKEEAMQNRGAHLIPVSSSRSRARTISLRPHLRILPTLTRPGCFGD
jgi:hypothetical protein